MLIPDPSVRFMPLSKHSVRFMPLSKYSVRPSLLGEGGTGGRGQTPIRGTGGRDQTNRVKGK